MTLFRRVAAGEPGEISGRRGHGDPAATSAAVSRDRFTARFTATDAMVLRDLAGQLAELVGGTVAGRLPGVSDQGSSEPAAGEEGEMDGPDMPGAARDLAELLGLAEDAGPPDDPAVARLLPDAYPDDPAASSEFRRYTERDLRAGKTAAARTVLATLPEHGGLVSLSGAEAQTWLRALNDIRLALGVRLGITEDADAELDRTNPEDPRFGALALYDWLSAMQDSLVRALW